MTIVKDYFILYNGSNNDERKIKRNLQKENFEITKREILREYLGYFK